MFTRTTIAKRGKRPTKERTSPVMVQMVLLKTCWCFLDAPSLLESHQWDHTLHSKLTAICVLRGRLGLVATALRRKIRPVRFANEQIGISSIGDFYNKSVPYEIRTATAKFKETHALA